MENRPRIDESARKSIEAWHEFISSAECVIPNQTQAETKIRFDGASETNGGLDTSEVKERIGACREAYENVGIVGNIIDLMVDFALEDFTIVHSSKQIENFYRNWAKRAGLYNISEQILKALYRDSNVPIMHWRGKIKADEARKLKKAIAADTKSTAKKNLLIKDEDSGKSNVIPIAYKLLDVLRFDKEGSELLGGLAYKYELPSEEWRWIKSPSTPQQKETALKLKEVYGDKVATDGYLYLDPQRISVLYYKKDDYRKWANPMLWRVIGDVRFKQTLRNMDISVAQSVQNTITLLKLGKMEEGLPPTKAAFQRLTNLMKIPSKSKTLVWDNLIDIQAEYPPVDKILGKEKYEQVDGDIRAGLGIPEVLVNGEGGNYSNSFLSVKTLLERLETGRIVLMAWIHEQIKVVAKAMGFRSLPWVKFRHMSLTDEEAERRIMLELVDRNMMSVQTALERIGENYEVELQRMKEEDNERKKLKESNEDGFALRKVSKFGPQITDLNETPEVSLEDDENEPKETPTQQENEGEKGGRPPGSKRKQEKQKPEEPKGKSLSYIIAPNDYESACARTDKIINVIGNTDISLDDWTEAVIRILSYTSAKSEITVQDIQTALELEFLATAPAKLERCVREVVRKSVEKFRKNNGRSPNKKELQTITSKAYAICNKAVMKQGE